MLYLNGYPVSHLFTHFPDQTTQVWKLPPEYFQPADVQYIEWMFSSEGEIMHLAQLVSLLHNQASVPIELFIRYLPYARQDKEIHNDNCFALYPFANLINTMNFSKVTILDPHSDVALKLIARSTTEYPVAIFNQVKNHLMPEVICYGDKSASLKYESVYKPDLPYIYPLKERDSETGVITALRLPLYNLTNSSILLGGVSEKNNRLEDKRILIVDDICDGGATILQILRELYSLNVSCVDVFVTYGIFSKGLRALKDNGVRRIFTSSGEVFEKENSNV